MKNKIIFLLSIAPLIVSAQEDTGYICRAQCYAQSCDFADLLEPIEYSTNLARHIVFKRAQILCQRQARQSGYRVGYLVKHHDYNSDNKLNGFWPLFANPYEDCKKDQSIPPQQAPDYFPVESWELIGG